MSRVVITGIGPVCAAGVGNKEFWDTVIRGNTKPVKEIFKLDSKVLDTFYVYRINKANRKKLKIRNDFLNEIGKKDVSDDLKFLISATELALKDSNLSSDKIYNDVALIVSHENPELGDFYQSLINRAYQISSSKKDLTKADFMEHLYSDLSGDAYNLQTFMFLFRIAKYFNMHGYTQYLNNACASGLYAIESGSQLIKSKKTKIVLVAAGDHPDIFKYLWFKKIGLYSPNGKLQPFSSNSNGFVFGEGGVGIVLEEYNHAKKRKARIYGEYLGGGFSQDCWKISFPAIKENYYEQSVLKALESSNLGADKIDLVVPHGVGNYITDGYESRVINKIFNSQNKPYVTTFKPYFGHNLGGSALLETALLLLAIKNKKIPGILNHRATHPKINLNLVTTNLSKNTNYVLKMACGFAGYNAAAVFGNVEES